MISDQANQGVHAAIGDRAASPAALREAVTAAKGDGPPIVLVLKRGDRFRTVTFDYHGGLRYPRLERIEGKGK